MKTKTEQAVELLQQGELRKALSIICKFRFGFTKDEQRTLCIARDTLDGLGTLYEQMGVNTTQEIAKSVAILQEKYTKVHILPQKCL